MRCEKCDKEIAARQSGAHSRWCGHSKNLNRLCKVCGKVFEHEDRRKSLCSFECKSVHTSNVLKNEEIRKKLSDARKSWLAKNPEKHPWKRNSKFDSEPCQKLKDALRSRSIEFHEEFMPLDDRFFAIDVAIPALKIGIEVNGQQHYNRNGSLKSYYQQRHDLIESAGWKIYEVHYSICYSQKRLDLIIDSIIENCGLDSVDLKFEIEQKPALLKRFSTRQEYIDSQKLSPEKLQLWKTAIESTDVTKYGFVGNLAKKMGCSHTHVRRVLNNYFKNVQVYKRKT